MASVLKRLVRATAACALIGAFVVPTPVLAQSHVVSPADLQKHATEASQARHKNVENLTKFMASPGSEKALKAAQMDPAQVKIAVASLSDAELANLSARADKAQADFAAGRISDRDLLLILVGIAALILIIVAVR